jgi:hypothetical protein
VGAVGGPTARERSQAVTPWLGGRIEAPLFPWLESELGGRLGFLWGGDHVRYHVHAVLDLWAGVALPLGPLRLGVRVEYRLADTLERVHGRDEMMDVSLVVVSVGVGVRF